MSFLRRLGKTQLVAFGALLVVAGAAAMLIALQVSVSDSAAVGATDAATLVFLYALLFGCIPVAFLGAPLYAALAHHGRANWLTAIAVGAAPGLGLFFVDKSFALWSLTCGVAVAMVTHVVCLRWNFSRAPTEFQEQ